MLAQHYKASHWIKQGLFEALTSFADFEQRVNRVAEEKDRGDIFEIFIEGYLATQTIAQCRRHWVVGSIPLEMRERYNLPNDGTGIDGIYEDLARDGCDVALILTAGGGSESIALHQTAVETPEARATYAAEAAQSLSADTIRRAMELDMAMVACNQSGWVPAWAYYHGGGSSIIDRTGRVAAVIPYRKILEHVRPDLAVGTVSR